VTFAHIAGLPIEETVLAGGPALLAAVGAVVTQLRARYLRRRSTPS
jgi:predicted alpha/beta-hydrolase family hydrolase